ncbi:MAG: alpha/beta fold hydrolase [Polyangiaceae bacterium]
MPAGTDSIGGLRRRAHLGLDLGTTPQGGVVVNGVTEGGPGEEAGVRPLDRITRVGERAVDHPEDVSAILREVVAGTALRLALARPEVGEVSVSLTVRARPSEAIAGGRVVLGAADAAGTHLRTILTLPEGDGPWPAVLHLQGIDTASSEHLDPSAPLLRLVTDWTRAGFATMRVERSGVGDSEGPPPAETDLDTELEGLLAALAALSEHPAIDRRRVFLFGHSIGGMIAPEVARRASVCGVVVFGSSAKRWRACAVGTTERQLALRGLAGDEWSRRVAAWAEMHAAVCRDGLTPAEAIARRPHLSILSSRQCRGATLFGHHASYFRQLDALTLTAPFRASLAPLLVLQGEFDWVCDASDAESIVAQASERPSPASVELETLARVGHDMRSHASYAASFESPRDGTWCGSVPNASVPWMRAR